jgi:hypothetical protein
MSTTYNGLIFRTQLEARWAAFFDLAGWEWRYNPAPVGNWAPDFLVKFPCRHSECSGSHSLMVSVVDSADLADLGGHPALGFAYGRSESGISCRADAGALFGSNPGATRWEMSHGAGGGVDDVPRWVSIQQEHWAEAGSLVGIRK